MATILFVDDEKNIRDLGVIILRKAGHTVVQAADGQSAVQELEKTCFDLILLDYMMPSMDGLKILDEVDRTGLKLPPTIFMTAYGSVDTAVKAMKAGASDYISKPFTTVELLHAIARNLHTQQLEHKVVDLERQVQETRLSRAAGLFSDNREMQKLLLIAKQAAASSVPVLIEGETGTGKERLARFIHDSSPQSKRPFVAVNCGALHPELLLSELFGHKRGAFTGAVEDRVGRFEAANGGTLFLDEVGELDPSAQVKLLRVLQEGTFERVGDPRTYHVDVRIVAATNRRLEEMVKNDAFRSDLYYRLAVIILRIPPLRDRPEDIKRLANEFAKVFAVELGRSNLQLSPDSLQELLSRRWMGNIRELRNVIQRSVVLTPSGQDVIQIDPTSLLGTKTGDQISAAFQEMANHAWTFDEMEKAYVLALLTRRELKVADICDILQIDSSTLWRKRKKYGI